MDLTNKRIVVTGGEGFLGHHLLPLLQERSPFVYSIKHSEFNLLQIQDAIQMYNRYHPQIVIHLAARVGGIQYNQANPASLFFMNLQMGLNVIHLAMNCGVEKLVCLGTICSYPRTPLIPFREDDLFEGYPDPTNAPYGLSKKALLTMCQSYRKQYGLNAIFLMPVNMFGEYDTFTDLQGHVVPMLIKRFINARENDLPIVEVWGSGNATREFLYAGDAAKAILLATEKYDKPEPMNIGSGQEIKIVDLAILIADLVGYKGQIRITTKSSI